MKCVLALVSGKMVFSQELNWRQAFYAGGPVLMVLGGIVRQRVVCGGLPKALAGGNALVGWYFSKLWPGLILGC